MVELIRQCILQTFAGYYKNILPLNLREIRSPWSILGREKMWCGKPLVELFRLLCFKEADSGKQGGESLDISLEVVVITWARGDSGLSDGGSEGREKKHWNSRLLKVRGNKIWWDVGCMAWDKENGIHKVYALPTGKTELFL